jgi:hypothetical protein
VKCNIGKTIMMFAADQSVVREANESPGWCVFSPSLA